MLKSPPKLSIGKYIFVVDTLTTLRCIINFSLCLNSHKENQCNEISHFLNK